MVYHNDPKFSDRQVWANSVEPELSDQSLLFAISATSFRHNVHKKQCVEVLGQLQQ